MADRFPLIANSSNNQIQELASGDTLDLTGNSVKGAGIITATTFSGALDGNASGLSGTPELTVSTLTGVAATFTGAVSIGGTLTYEDVTNVDSIGVVTARSGVHFGATGSGTLVVGDSDGIGIGTDNPAKPLHVFSATGDSMTRFESGDATIQVELNDSDGSAAIGAVGNDFRILTTGGGGDERLRVTSSGGVGIGTTVPDSTLTVNGTARMTIVDLGTVTGNVVLNFGDSNNFKLTMGGNLTFGAPTGITTGQSGVITLVQDGTGSRTASWDGAYMFKSGTAPTLSTGVGKTDCIAYYCFEPPYIVAGTFIGIGTQ